MRSSVKSPPDASRSGIGTVVTPKKLMIWRERILFVIREEDELLESLRTVPPS